ncbi:MAG: NUDIX hydrolase [Nocardioidaceae bacterium]
MSEQTLMLRDIDALPSWLRPLARAASDVDADTLSARAPTPPAGARPSAVLMLFGEGTHGPDLLLTERAHTMRSHAGQIAFPGGAADPGDAGPADTALREAREEVGVEAAGVDVFGRLPALWLPPSNAVTTILGWWREPCPIDRLEPAEVESAFRTPIAELVDPVNRFSVRHPSGWVGPAFTVSDGLMLWGFTAGIVSRLFEHAGWEREWDRSRVVTLPDRALPDQPLPDER